MYAKKNSYQFFIQREHIMSMLFLKIHNCIGGNRYKHFKHCAILVVMRKVKDAVRYPLDTPIELKLNIDYPPHPSTILKVYCMVENCNGSYNSYPLNNKCESEHLVWSSFFCVRCQYQSVIQVK